MYIYGYTFESMNSTNHEFNQTSMNLFEPAFPTNWAGDCRTQGQGLCAGGHVTGVNTAGSCGCSSIEKMVVDRF